MKEIAFKDLNIGDMFNIKPYRLVKTGENAAIVVMAGGSMPKKVGDFIRYEDFSGFDIVPLYSRLIEDQT